MLYITNSFHFYLPIIFIFIVFVLLLKSFFAIFRIIVLFRFHSCVWIFFILLFLLRIYSLFHRSSLHNSFPLAHSQQFGFVSFSSYFSTFCSSAVFYSFSSFAIHFHALNIFFAVPLFTFYSLFVLFLFFIPFFYVILCYTDIHIFFFCFGLFFFFFAPSWIAILCIPLQFRSSVLYDQPSKYAFYFISFKNFFFIIFSFFSCHFFVRLFLIFFVFILSKVVCLFIELHIRFETFSAIQRMNMLLPKIVFLFFFSFFLIFFISFSFFPFTFHL